jgi:hypothetical protein
VSRAITVDARVFRESVSEAAMQQTITELVTMRGGRVWHVRRSDVAPETVDLPDLLILDPMGARVILAELKSQKRTVTLGQQAVLAMARECGDFHPFLIRPTPKDHTETSYDRFLEFLKGGEHGQT